MGPRNSTGGQCKAGDWPAGRTAERSSEVGGESLFFRDQGQGQMFKTHMNVRGDFCCLLCTKVLLAVYCVTLIVFALSVRQNPDQRQVIQESSYGVYT